MPSLCINSGSVILIDSLGRSEMELARKIRHYKITVHFHFQIVAMQNYLGLYIDK